MKTTTAKMTPCPRCHGTGEIGSAIISGNGWTIAVTRKTERCPACDGIGMMPVVGETLRRKHERR